MKEFNDVINESTCQKRITVCEIYDSKGNLLSRESNRCSPSGGLCHRLDTVQSKDNYDKESCCNWVHAEINAIQSLHVDAQPYKSIIYGHSFYCDNCENELKKIGVEVFEINDKILLNK